MIRLFPLVLVLAGCPSDDTPAEAPDADEAAEAPAEEEAPTEGADDGDPANADMEAIPAPADVAAPPQDATTTESGLAYKFLEPGEGDTPTASSFVVVHYTGWTTDGKMFDSSYKRDEPAKFPLNGVIAGWTEGLQLMKTGSKARLWIPEDLAYKGMEGKPAGMLVFDVELLSHMDPAKPPENVSGPPADATKTDSGLAYKVLDDAGDGATPGPDSTVLVHYSGWTTDGENFDSSYKRGRPAGFPVKGVIAGWTEGLQLMNKGDRYRFWIPGDLAYGDTPGRPNGMLVFDVELVDFR